MSTPPQAALTESLILDHRENGVAIVTLNRPDRLNALNKDLTVALNQALGSIATDKHVSVVVITGAGRAFCAGGDLAVIGKGHQENDMTELEPLLRSGMQAVGNIQNGALRSAASTSRWRPPGGCDQTPSEVAGSQTGCTMPPSPAHGG